MPGIGMGIGIGLNTPASGGAPAPAWDTWMMGTQWNIINNSKTQASGTKTGYFSRSSHFIGSGNVKKLRFGWLNFHVGSGSTGAATAVGNPFNMVDASAEYNGTTYPILFSSLRTTVIGDGLAVWSDVFDVQANAGVSLWNYDNRVDIKFKGTLDSAAYYVESSAPRANAAIAGQQTYFYDPAKVVPSSTDAPGMYTWTYQNGGTTADYTGSISTGWVPFVIAIHENAPDVWCFFGDSISAGTGDSGLSNSGLGWPQRAVGMCAKKPASLNLSVHGSTRRAGMTDQRILDLLPYNNLGCLFKGANDFGNAGTSISAAQFYSDMLGVRAIFLNAGMSKVIVCGTTPRANPGSAGQLEAIQTPFTGWDSTGSNPIVYNAMLPGGFDGVIPMNSVRGTLSVYNMRDGDAFDTTHWNPSGNVHMAEEAAPIMQTFMLR